MIPAYIARQAIFDRSSNAIGYELLFRDSPNNYFPKLDLNIATSKLIIQNHIQGDIEQLCMGKLAFINFTEHCLINKYPLLFSPEQLVIELVGIDKPSKNLEKILKYYTDKGYKIALTGYDVAKHWQQIFDYIAFIKVDVEIINVKRLMAMSSTYKRYNIELLAEKVETRYQLQSLAGIGFTSFQGFYYHEPEMVEGQSLVPAKAQMLHLISETFKAPFNFNNIANIISHDINLSVSLLKLVNNVATGNRIEITSLKQASTYLGEEKLKQFVTILALSKLSCDQTDEIAKQSLITGKLMLSLANSARFNEIKDYAFITGLLSAIEVLLAMPMADILKTMPLAPQIEQALINHEGKLGELLEFTTNYITGQQDEVDQKLALYAIAQDFIQKEFVLASQWCMELELET